MKRIILSALAAVVALNASAEGYQVNTLSAKQLGMGHTGVSQKLNSESVWFNPAAAAYQEQKFTVAGGFTGIAATAKWTSLNDYMNPTQSAESDNSLSTPLYLNLNYKVTDDLAVGLNVNTPYGSSMNWGDSWAGAHLIQSIKLSSYSVQPTVSYKLFNDKLSIGAGLMVSWGNFELSRSMFKVGEETNADVATILEGALSGLKSPEEIAAAKAEITNANNNPLVSATLGGDAGVTFGVNVGLMYDINPRWSLGMSYRSKMLMSVDKGHASLDYFNSTATLALANNFAGMDTGSFSASLPMPSTLSLGATFRPTDRWSLSAEFQWVQWSAYDSLVVTFNEKGLEGYNQDAPKNYSNTMITRVGAEYLATEWLTARAGFYVDESPVASDYLNPETPSMTKAGFTCGVSVMPLSNKNFSIDLAYGYIKSADAERAGSYPYVNSLKAAMAKSYAGAAEKYAAAAGQYAAAGDAAKAEAMKAESGKYAAMATDAKSKVLDPFSGNYETYAHTFSIGLSWGF